MTAMGLLRKTAVNRFQNGCHGPVAVLAGHAKHVRIVISKAIRIEIYD